MPADAPRATAEDGFTPGDRPGDEPTEGTAEFGPASGARPPAAAPGHRDIDAEDVGDPAEFAEPAARRPAPAPPDLPNFVDRSGDDQDDQGLRDQGLPPNGSDRPAGPVAPPGPGGPDADGIPPPPTLDPTVVGPGGPLPPPAHLRNEGGAP